MTEIDIEIGTFPTDEGVLVMGLMIQTPYAIETKHEIKSALKLQSIIERDVRILGESHDIGEYLLMVLEESEK
jgi:hypothetical protein